MKTNFVRVSFLVLGVAAAAFAQVPIAVKANVPFEFKARGFSMPAGHYVVETTGAGNVVLHMEDARSNVVVQTNQAVTLDASKDSRLVFHRYGGQYFLYQVWTEGWAVGRELPMSQQERALAKGSTNSKRVIVAAAK